MNRKPVFVQDIALELGRMLRARRCELKLSLDTVSQNSRVPREHIIAMDHGDRDTSFARLQAVCIALGLEIVFQECTPRARQGEWLHKAATVASPVRPDIQFE